MDIQAAFLKALLKKDNKRTEVDRNDVSQFLHSSGLYHSKLLQSISPFATVETCKTDFVIYAQHEMVGLQYWYLLKGEVRLYSSKKGRFHFIKTGMIMHVNRESLSELGKYEYTVQQGDFFGVETFVNSDPHAQRQHSALATIDGTIILPIQGATPLRYALESIGLPHQHQVHTLSHWCKIEPELRSDHEVSLILHHLKGFKFFSALDDHLGLSWAKMCKLVNVPAQTLLFQQNDASDSIYFVIDGSCQVRIKKQNQTVKKSTLDGKINWQTLEADFGECVHTFESGESFGELSLDHAKPNQIPRRTASIICIQDCVLLRVDSEAYYTLQKMGQSSRIILSQWTKPLQIAAGSRSSESVDMLSFIMQDFKYFSFMDELTRRLIAQNLVLIDTEPGNIIFVEGETVFRESGSALTVTDESSMQSNVFPNIQRKWTTDSVCAVLCGSVGAFKRKKTAESATRDLASYLHLNAAEQMKALSDNFGVLQMTIVAGEGFGEDLLHRKSLEVKRNLSYVCLEPCKLLFYEHKTFSSTLHPTHELGSGKSKMIMRKAADQRTFRDLCIVFGELAGLHFIQKFIEQDFHDFFSKARFGNCPAFTVINKNFPKQFFGIVLSGAMSVHQTEDQELDQNEVGSVKDVQCHAIRLMFGACKHIVKEGDVFGEYNLKSCLENMKLSLKINPSRCTYITRLPTEMIYWDVCDLSLKLLEQSQKGISSTKRVIQVMSKKSDQRTDDDVAVIDQYLRSVNFFVSYPDLSRILSSPAFSLQALDACDVIFKEGDIVTHFYVLLQGSIQTHSILKPDPERFEGRSTFGEMGVDEFHSVGSRRFTCSVAENSTFFLQIPFEAFLQLEKQKMVAMYRSAKSFLVQHSCFRKIANNSLLVDELVSECQIFCKSKNDPFYLEGHTYERSIWAVLKGSVELVLNVDAGIHNSDDLVLDVKMNTLGENSNSLAKAAFFKQSSLKHSLGVLRTGAATAPFAIPNNTRQISRSSADHDAVAAENDTVMAVFFMKNAKDDSMTAMCMIEQNIAALSQWRRFRKIAGDHAIGQTFSITSPKRPILTPTKSSHRYQSARPKIGLEGKVDANLFLPKLAGSRCVDTMHNDDILDVNEDHLNHFAVLSEASLDQLCVKLMNQTEEEVLFSQGIGKLCPISSKSPILEAHVNADHREVLPTETTPDVGKKILNIFASDKFKRKAFIASEINSMEMSGVEKEAEQNTHRGHLTTDLSEYKIGHPSSPESQTTEAGPKIRNAVEDIFAENKNVASKIAEIMSGNKYKYNASQLQMESSISETLEAARQNAASIEPSWKDKVVDILKTDVFQRTKEDPENVLQHALSVAAELAQKERDSRIPKERILIDTFCKRVREQLLLGEAVDSLAFNQLNIYVPEKPVRSFGRHCLSDTAKKLFAQDTQTKFGADEKQSDAFRMLRPQRVASTLLTLKNRHKQYGKGISQKGSFPASDEDLNRNRNQSLSVTKILNDDFPTKLKSLSLARVSTPVVQEKNSVRKEIAGLRSVSTTQDMELQQSAISVSRELSVANSLIDEQGEGSNLWFCRDDHGFSDPNLNITKRSDAERHAKVDLNIGNQKSALFDYLCNVTQTVATQCETNKLHHFRGSHHANFTKFEAKPQQFLSKSVSSNMPNTQKKELFLTGRAKVTHSVTELGNICQWQNQQAKHSMKTSQYRPIIFNSETQQVFTLTESQFLHGTRLQVPQSMAIFPHSLTSHSPRIPIAQRANDRKTTSKPKSREYSSHGVLEHAFEETSFPALNEVLNQNSPSSSKPQTPNKMPWSPNDSRPPSRSTSMSRGTGMQPHITGIAFDDESQASQMLSI